jgi:hypothetical protein
MSRGYRITWVAASRTVTTEDCVKISVSLLEILPGGEMLDLLRDELARDGWTRQDDGAMTTTVGEAEVRLEPDGKTLTLRRETTQTVNVQGTSADDAAKRAADAAESATRIERGAIEAALTAAEPDVRARLNEAVQRVYLEALRKKAATLGQIESVRESTSPDGEYEVTIKVRA